MRSHPAYPAHGSSHTLLAMVTSAFQATPQARSLRLVTSRGIQSAWLRKETLPFQVAPGQVWKFIGEIVNLGHYGEQFDIRDGVPSLPADLLLVPFLAHHVPGLSQTRAQRMWKTLGNDLVAAMEHGEVSRLARALSGPTAVQIAKLAVHTWADQVAYTQLAHELYQYGFTQQALRQAVSHYGKQSLALIQDDPFRLLAFAELGPVDQAALERFGVPVDDKRRLMGILDAAVHTLHDHGTAIFSQTQLETAIHQLTNLQRQQVIEAINLALQHGRLVAATERHLMGDGFARIERDVVQFLASRDRALHEPTSAASWTNPDGACQIGRVASAAVAAPVSITLAHEEPAAFKFVQYVADLFSSRDERCYVLAGSDALCQRIHAATGLQPVTLRRAVEAPLVELSDVQPGRAIVIVSSTIDFVAMAQLLPQLRPTDQVFFVGQLLRQAGERTLLLPALLAIDQIFRRELPNTIDELSVIDADRRGALFSNATRRAYAPRESHRRGVFWICVADDAFDRAIVGVSHQLRRHGSVAIVARDSDERHQYTQLIGEAMAEACVTPGHRTVSVVAADALEPSDSDSTVVVLRQPEARSAAWLQSALGTAASRAVVVATVELDYQLSTTQEDKSVLSGFVARWRRVTADQEHQGQSE